MKISFVEACRAARYTMIDMDIFEMQTALAYDMAICRFLENQQADDQIRLVALKYIRQVLTQQQASKIPLS